MKYTKIIYSLSSLALISAQDFCNTTKHQGEFLNLSGDKSGTWNGINFELSGSKNCNVKFYSDGSFNTSFNNDEKCDFNTGLTFDNPKTFNEIEQLYADFKVGEKSFEKGIYISYVGVHGTSSDPNIEFYIIDHWVADDKDFWNGPKIAEHTVNDATYSIHGVKSWSSNSDDYIAYFDVRNESHDCGTIDIHTHIEHWKKAGLKFGKLNDVKILNSVVSMTDGATGTLDVPYAKVYFEGKEPTISEPINCPTTIIEQGFTCCINSNCEVILTDEYGDWSIENGVWCKCDSEAVTNTYNNTLTSTSTIAEPTVTNIPTSCPLEILNLGYPCCANSNCEVYYTDGYGDWSVDNDEWCYCLHDNSITSTTTTESPSTTTSTINSNETCPPKVLKLGFTCCSIPNCEVFYTDDDGDWSVVNDEWCYCLHDNSITSTTTTESPAITTSTIPAITTSTINSNETCPPKVLKLGFTCCSNPNCEVYYTDDDGDWSVENDQWCYCRNTDYVATSTTEIPAVTTQAVETSSYCPSEIIEQGFACCSNANCEVFVIDELGGWSIEESVWCLCNNENDTSTTLVDDETPTITTQVVETSVVTTQAVETNSSCPSEILELDFDCCSEANCVDEVLFVDDYGSWSIENNEWCFCNSDNVTSEVTTLAVETPVVETPVVETPVVEIPIVETPVVETPVAETPIVETPVAETPVAETPVV
ncbi:family 11 glycoside hydrolase [Piromyces sp. E2]|nr:family 11 glycoside hydrolase [Piromyces sp. E2]|eukprot:OUM60015.1 family 11 glycoside hydrolase [Piromyces sp. E2]